MDCQNTFIKQFNPRPNLKLERRIQVSDFQNLSSEMISAEISHLIAYVLICFVVLVLGLGYSHGFGITIMLVNVFINLYLSFLQQQNIRQKDRFLKK
ncbi:hypothetical protein [Galbibacter sp.]|uniref:glycosyl-4,4'-diaponeurosporenoate acyltransferase CrtO family protein n=1 Tax=Galbibacter sp. TaxID=2918471 RepID=UPI003A94A403